MLIFSFSIIISIYHFGIEQGLIEESSVCASDNINLLTKEEILNSLKKININCKDVAFKIFNLSLTTYNIFISFYVININKNILFSNAIKK